VVEPKNSLLEIKKILPKKVGIFTPAPWRGILPPSPEAGFYPLPYGGIFYPLPP